MEFSTEDAFRSEYVSNIANGGIFVVTSQALEVRAPIVVEIHLLFCDRVIDLEGEVVHCVPEEMASAGAQPGAAVQFSTPVRELVLRFEPIVGVIEGDERVARSGQRAAPRSPARVRCRVRSASRPEVEGRTRDMSSTGMLLAVRGEAFPVGEAITATVCHPNSGEEMEVGGTVVRHVASEFGDVKGMGIEFHSPEARQTEVSNFINEVRSAEHSRRLGGITGPIAELGIENLLQMFGTTSPQGTLVVSRGVEEGVIAFQGGLMQAARFGKQTGTDALREMLTWREGSFEFHTSIDENDIVADPVSLSGAIVDAIDDGDRDAEEREAESGLQDLIDTELDDEDDTDFDTGFDEEADGVADDDGESALDVDLEQVEPLPAARAPHRISPDTCFDVAVAAADGMRDQLSKTEEAVLDLAAVGMSVSRMVGVIPEPELDIRSALDALLDLGLITCR